MYNSKLNFTHKESIKRAVRGLDIAKFAEGYIEMSKINSEIANEFRTLESEGNHSIEGVIGVDE